MFRVTIETAYAKSSLVTVDKKRLPITSRYGMFDGSNLLISYALWLSISNSVDTGFASDVSNLSCISLA